MDLLAPENDLYNCLAEPSKRPASALTMLQKHDPTKDHCRIGFFPLASTKKQVTAVTQSKGSACHVTSLQGIWRIDNSLGPEITEIGSEARGSFPFCLPRTSKTTYMGHDGSWACVKKIFEKMMLSRILTTYSNIQKLKTVRPALTLKQSFGITIAPGPKSVFRWQTQGAQASRDKNPFEAMFDIELSADIVLSPFSPSFLSCLLPRTFCRAHPPYPPKPLSPQSLYFSLSLCFSLSLSLSLFLSLFLSLSLSLSFSRFFLFFSFSLFLSFSLSPVVFLEN